MESFTWPVAIVFLISIAPLGARVKAMRTTLAYSLKDGKERIWCHDDWMIRVGPKASSQCSIAPKSDFDLAYIWRGNCRVLAPKTMNTPIAEVVS